MRLFLLCLLLALVPSCVVAQDDPPRRPPGLAPT
jgi:hypothetical protein